MKMPCVTRLCLLSSTFLLPLPSEAHNGALAIAVPVQGITIDGDLSDWPQDMRRYPILLSEASVKPRDERDCRAFFRVGYDPVENALYLAVEVEDESYVFIPGGGNWSAEDGGEVFVGLAHGEKDSLIAQYYVVGERRFVAGAGILEDFAVKRGQEGNTLFYEWRITSRGQPLRPGQVLGFDLVVDDRDADGSFTWMGWGKGILKWVSTDRRGDMLLVGGSGELGKLSGRVVWEDTRAGVGHALVRVESLAEPWWVQAETDQEGSWSTELPGGQYRVKVAGRASGREKEVALSAGKTSELILELRSPQGQIQQVGEGKGLWQRFGIEDGLPGSFVSRYSEEQELSWSFLAEAGFSRGSAPVAPSPRRPGPRWQTAPRPADTHRAGYASL